MLEKLKEEVYNANIDLFKKGLVIYTWGNVSAIDRERKAVVIKPSGVSYDDMTPSDMVVVSLSGDVIEGNLNPSSDTPTHLELYKAFPDIGGVVHTHSTYATSWAQSGNDLPVFGTTHADYFKSNIPCARNLTNEEIESEYERNTGLVIIEEFAMRGINPTEIPAVLCKNHGPFVWGSDASDAVYNSVVLEEVAKMALLTKLIDPVALPAPLNICNKHFNRKHGPNSYYGQNKH